MGESSSPEVFTFWSRFRRHQRMYAIMIITSTKTGKTVPRLAFNLILGLDFCDELEGVESGETVVVEWLLVFTGLAGLMAVAVCSVVDDGVCRDEKLIIKVVCEEPKDPITVCALPLGTEKVPLPLSQLQVPPCAAGPQHHLLSPQDTSLPLLSETGSSMTTLSAGLLSYEQIFLRNHTQAKSTTSILVPSWVGASPTKSTSHR